MRRFLGPVLIGFGAFLLVAAVLLKFYAYPKLAVAPIDQDSVTRTEATGATIFDTSSLSEITTDVSVADTTRGDVSASNDAGDNTRVWTGTQTITSSDGVVRSQSADRAAFDAHTGEAVNCCGAFTEDEEGVRTPTTRSGLIYKFPFGTEKKTYQWWDSSLGDTVDAEFVEEDEVEGLDVYVFTTVTEPTVIGTRDVPGSLVGEDAATVTADSVYSNTRTLYVEPVTGAIVDRREQQKNTVALDGVDMFTTTEADLTYTDEQVKDNVEEFESKASALNGVRTTFPLVALILGLIAVAAGVLLGRRREDSGDAARREDALAGTP